MFSPETMDQMDGAGSPLASPVTVRTGENGGYMAEHPAPIGGGSTIHIFPTIGGLHDHLNDHFGLGGGIHRMPSI